MTFHIIKTTSKIILHGGVLCIATPIVKYLAVNIALTRSNAWLDGVIFINKNPYYRLSAANDNYIELKNINNNYFLAVNEKVVYKHNDVFGYTINVKLNETTTNTPYATFFKYY